MNIETKAVGMDDRAIEGTGAVVLCLGAAIFAPFLAGPALLAGTIAGGIALKDPNTPNVVKAAIWGCFAGLYGIVPPAILSMMFGDDLGELSQLVIIFKLGGAIFAIAGVVHLGMALNSLHKGSRRDARAGR